ncbi:hypothetical protein LSAT2_014841 [Lamellibrachia satsuma]|nr:hypothetical protein LSAT2_014841 [Lamellibrachia satsuma]
MASNAWSVLIALFQVSCLVQGDAILQVRMVTFKNSGGKDWVNKRCDPSVLFGKARCDHKFTFCFDTFTGNSNPKECSYQKYETGEFINKDDVTFDHDMKSVKNPIQLSIHRWPGAIRFKVKITDDDSIGDDDLVDVMNERWKPHSRPQLSSKTSLALNLRLYCNQNYYSQRCDQFCKASNGPKQYYTCDPDTGDKICRPGWESHNCDIVSDDCIDNECSNGATCRDGFRRYTCVCPHGFTGEHCMTNINECAVSPCQNGGQCVDQIGGYKCTCKPGYVGVNCSLSVCHSSISPCQNGGSCYTHSGSPRCLCPPEFTGDDCQLDKCAEMTCENRGTCENGKCVCRAGYLGHLCEINLCRLTQCLHGATCQDGVCHCVPGYNGRYCETQINECDSDPCQHEGTCRSHGNGYTCRCLPANSGVHCELVIPTQPALEWNHVTTPGPVVSPGSVVSQSPVDMSGLSTPATGAARENSDVRTISTSQSFPLKASSAEASVQFQRGPDDDEVVTGISNPDYDDAMTGACNGVCNGSHGAAPPPYTSHPRSAQFVDHIYDSPPPPREVAAIAAGGRLPAGGEAPQLPIKAALRRGV